jgi:hypothetical protein
MPRAYVRTRTPKAAKPETLVMTLMLFKKREGGRVYIFAMEKKTALQRSGPVQLDWSSMKIKLRQ